MKQDSQVRSMRLALGAAALVIQPKIIEVASEHSWGNFEAVLHLLDMEAKHKVSEEKVNKCKLIS